MMFLVAAYRAGALAMAEPMFRVKTQDQYVMIAMANASRAATIRNAVLELTDDVALAADGTAAAELMSKRGAPRLLITDLSLPALDGFALVRQLRETAPQSRSAVIALSAHESLRTAARDLADSLGIASVLLADPGRLNCHYHQS